MWRSKLRIALNILRLLASILLIGVGVSPVIYAYLIREAPVGPSEPATVAVTLMFMCIFLSLTITVIEGLVGTVQATIQLIGGTKKGEIDNEPAKRKYTTC